MANTLSVNLPLMLALTQSPDLDTLQRLDLSGWTLAATDGTPSISLSGTVPAYGYFLLERTDDNSAPGVVADLNVYEGLSHAEYLMVQGSPESKAVAEDLSAFLVEHLP